MNELLDALKEIIITTGNASVNENQTLDLLKQLAGKCVFATMIKEVDSNLIIYMNTPALDYFGLAAHFIDRYGISFAKEILHPDFFHLFPVELDFFSDKNNYVFYSINNDFVPLRPKCRSRKGNF